MRISFSSTWTPRQPWALRISSVLRCKAMRLEMAGSLSSHPGIVSKFRKVLSQDMRVAMGNALKKPFGEHMTH